MAFIADRLSRIKPSPTNAAQGKFLEMKAAGIVKTLAAES